MMTMLLMMVKLIKTSLLVVSHFFSFVIDVHDNGDNNCGDDDDDEQDNGDDIGGDGDEEDDDGDADKNLFTSCVTLLFICDRTLLLHHLGWRSHY